MPKPGEIINRATGGPAPKPTGLAAVWQGMTALAQRLVALEKRPAPRDGRDGTNGRDGRDGKDGSSVTIADVAPVVEKAVSDAVAGIPVPKDGKDGRDGVNGKDGRSVDGVDVEIVDRETIVLRITTGDVEHAFEIGLPEGRAGKDGADGKDGRDGVDGTSVSIEDVAPLIASAVEKAFSAIPLPKDGVDGKDGRDGRDGIAGRSVVRGSVDDDGRLVLAYTDGSEEIVGVVLGREGKEGPAGKDGVDGKPGAKGDRGDKGDRGERGQAGRDGRDGVNGRDGSTFAFSDTYEMPVDAVFRVVEMVDEAGVSRRILTLD